MSAPGRPKGEYRSAQHEGVSVSASAKTRGGRIVVLMYHGLFDGERELADIDAADRPYAVSLADFRLQLDALAQAGLAVLDPQALTLQVPAQGGVVLTFDDGHGSNHRYALPELLSRGHKGVFFATSDFIGQRRGFCTWPQLREMAGAGMTIGSHGRTHRFFDDMSEADARAEFIDSKAAIEQLTGTRADQISFPGGRYAPRQLAWARQAGYTQLHTSAIGSLAPRPLAVGATLPRVAIKGGTPLDRYLAVAHAEPGTMLPAQIISGAKRAVRRVLGNRLYHAVYERIAG